MRGVDYRDIFDDSVSSTKLITGASLVASELRLLMNMKKYTLFFGNEMGLDCEKYIGLTNRVATFNLIRSEIETLFKKYKRASIRKIDMSFNEETNSIDILMTVFLVANPNRTFTVPFSISE
jgi:hypothetical protein